METFSTRETSSSLKICSPRTHLLAVNKSNGFLVRIGFHDHKDNAKENKFADIGPFGNPYSQLN